MKNIKILFIVSLVLFFLEILFLRFDVISMPVGKGWIGVCVLPPFVATILFSFIWHNHLYEKNEKSLRMKFLKVIFFISSSGLLLIWAAIFWFFVFQ